MMGYQTDDGVPGQGGVTTLMSYQSGILHSLIFCTCVTILGLYLRASFTLLHSKNR